MKNNKKINDLIRQQVNKNVFTEELKNNTEEQENKNSKINSFIRMIAGYEEESKK